MNDYNFDTVVDRRHTASLKWDKFSETNILPMWVADMDFETAPEIVEALKRRIDHKIFGYPLAPEELSRAVTDHLRGRYDWHVDASWLVWLPGLVTGINLACRAVCGVNDAVITNVPIYPPFLTAPGFSNCRVITSPMIEWDGVWEIDFKDLRKKRTEYSRLFLLCNPQNPTGRVFSKSELSAVADFCCRHNLVICSDEIHCDLLFDDVEHIPTASLGPKISDLTITLMAPSKTYNIPGLCCSFAVISNPKLRQQFIKAAKGIVPEVNVLGLTACLAAYTKGDKWLGQLRQYLRQNRDFLTNFVRTQLPDLTINRIQATYLAWIGIQKLAIDNPTRYFEAHGIGLSDGRLFGLDGYVRLNFGCPRKTLEDGLIRVRNAVSSLDNAIGNGG